MPSLSSFPLSAVRLAAGLAALALSAGTAAAQETADLPFTAGQKALHVAVGESFGIGGLFFRSPTSAWQVEAAVLVVHTESEQRSPFGGGESDATDYGAQLRAGLRSMRALGGNTLAYRTVGLLGGFSGGSGEIAGEERERSSWDAGVFLDLGGQYLFSPRFGLGVEVGAALRYTSVSQEIAGTEMDGSGFSLGTTAARLTGTLYF